MATTIYWFSGTGNSLHTARAIASGLEDQTQVISLARAWQAGETPPPGSRVGLVFPVYAWGPPLLVRRFVRKLPAEAVSSVFAVATYAGTLGPTLETLQRQLAERGLKMENGFAVKLPENYPPMGGPPGEEKQKRIIDRAEQKIQEIIACLNQPEPVGLESPNLLTRLLGKVANPVFSRRVSTADKNFYADEKCNQCGVCARVCPVDNIAMPDQRPQWLGHCEQCFACLHWCPQAAIQYGRRSRRQPRYHHPAVGLNDFIKPPQGGGAHEPE